MVKAKNIENLAQNTGCSSLRNLQIIFIIIRYEIIFSKVIDYTDFSSFKSYSKFEGNLPNFSTMKLENLDFSCTCRIFC